MLPHPLSPPDQIYRYMVEHSFREPEVLRRLRAVTAELPLAAMQISPEQGQFMQLLIRLIGATRCIDIGTFTGYSSLVVALALPSNGKVITCDVSEEWTAIARGFWQESGVAERIQLRLQPALTTLDELLSTGQAGTYDFAFIDADKTAYTDYYERCLSLVRLNGLIMVDNTLWYGAVADPEDKGSNTVALRAFNDHVHHDERVDVVLLPFSDGVTLLRKRQAIM